MDSYDKLADSKKSFISDRIRKLVEILKMYSPLKREKHGIKDALAGLVFVKERFIASMINVSFSFFFLYFFAEAASLSCKEIS